MASPGIETVSLDSPYQYLKAAQGDHPEAQYRLQ